MKPSYQRLESLDVLRGFDCFAWWRWKGFCILSDVR